MQSLVESAQRFDVVAQLPVSLSNDQIFETRDVEG